MKTSLTKLLDRAADTVRDMQASGGRRVVLQPFTPLATTELPNEAVLFVKPEITRPDHAVKVRDVMELLGGAFDEYSIEVGGSLVLGAEYLARHDLVAQHYGVINQVSRLGLEALQPDAARKIAGMRQGNEAVLGGHQILEKHPKVTPQALGAIWDKGSGTKVGSGAYAQRIRVGGEDILALNGFHPSQITHFTERGRSIVVFAIRSTSSWRTLRQVFLGATDPNKAVAGSFRRVLMEQKDHYGVPQVNQGLNGAHLSAGPLEGLAELMRYLSDFDGGTRLPADGTVMGSGLIRAGFGVREIDRLLGNARLYTSKGTLAPAFDLTEEMDWRDAVNLLVASAKRNEQ